MKKIIFLVLVLAFSSAAYSQNIPEEQVPSPVKDNLYASFKATDVEWEMEDNVYEAGYLENGMEKSVILNPDGTVISVETQIDPASLPTAATAYIETNYPGAVISEAEYIETNNSVFYGVEILHNGVAIDLLFDKNGNFIQRDDPGDDDED